MPIGKLLIANRGEIAIRIAEAAEELGIATVAIHPEDDADSLHTRVCGESRCLPGKGVHAYLDMQAVIEAALDSGCDAIHPGYGFLSEQPAFALLCREKGLCFVGPEPATLELLGDKGRARALARQCDVPTPPGTGSPATLEEVIAFREQTGGAIIIKAVAGGGGRGMRILRPGDDLSAAWQTCAAEAKAAFGSDALYAERLMPGARHVEVQIIGDGQGGLVHAWERECSLQRRNQKLIEVAPAPGLDPAVREQLLDAALRMARTVNYRSLGTFEFLLDADGRRFVFIEANPRLQVEHTVTEAVVGMDLVQTQLLLAGGSTLDALGLTQNTLPPPTGFAIQLRINQETLGADGELRPSAGTLQAFEPPGGPGIRVDTHGYGGYTSSPHYDSLLAKLVVHSRSPQYGAAVDKARRALERFRIAGVDTNRPLLLALLQNGEVRRNTVHTRFVDEHLETLVAAAAAFPEPESRPAAAHRATDPTAPCRAPEGTITAPAPMHGQLVALDVVPGQKVRKGEQIALIEAMKMQHVVSAPEAGTVRELAADVPMVVAEGQAIAFIEPLDTEEEAAAAEDAVDPDHIRPDLAEALERHALTQDDARPQAVARRHRLDQRTARENVDDLCDPGSFIEYGALTFAAQRQRRSVEDLIRSTPADGLVAGLGAVNGTWFDEERARCAVLAYDYTVLAGTQGTMNHKKTDRVLQVAEEQELPVVFFTEGGGGRPGDTDNATKVAGLDQPSFLQYARLTGLAPRIAIVSGRCFAGNAVFAGSSDLIVATRNASLGMAGPAMIEGGGLGVYAPEEVGPMDVQVPNGVVDCLVQDEREGTAVAKQLLAYFQGALPEWSCADQRMLRSSIPENRLRSYDIRALLSLLADTGSVLELRPRFAPGMLTAFLRIEGRPMGVIANDPRHLGGAIDADGADKAARFMQLCDAFDVPMLSLCDTPGFMVGPAAEKTALVRHTSRMFVTAASLQVPLFCVVLRKGYGLGAMGMAAGSFHAPVFNAAWPTGEFGGMGLEGAVRLAYRKEIAEAGDEAAQRALFDKLVAEAYERGKALSMAVSLEIDAVIDPADTRRWIVRGLKSVRKAPPRHGKRRPMVDTW
ncbi:MAG: hypothetical protein JJT90_11800 [Ectothiorhodospiraceae bacterium]|nr:hypothetical protein [Ectothiorhodospiraceae bacterium]